ncbi:MAG: DNA-binding CsgD family transcriptional regulator [Enterobacterales bacterium]
MGDLFNLAVKVKLIDNSKNDDTVLKLTNLEGPSEPQQLQDKLNITKRESHVLLWIAHGKTNKEVTEILAISPKTVDKHLEKIYRKLGVGNRTSAATIATKALAE